MRSLVFLQDTGGDGEGMLMKHSYILVQIMNLILMLIMNDSKIFS